MKKANQFLDYTLLVNEQGLSKGRTVLEEMRLRILSHSDVLPVKKSEVNKLVMDRAVELFQFAARFFRRISSFLVVKAVQ